jgi:hypothetical protein
MRLRELGAYVEDGAVDKGYTEQFLLFLLPKKLTSASVILVEGVLTIGDWTGVLLTIGGVLLVDLMGFGVGGMLPGIETCSESSCGGASEWSTGFPDNKLHRLIIVDSIVDGDN